MKDTTGFYTYILRCADGTLYTGWTIDPKRRLRSHNSGRGARYTRVRLPVSLVYCERHETKQEAMSREWAIKQLTRQEKLRLIEEAGEVRDSPSETAMTAEKKDAEVNRTPAG